MKFKESKIGWVFSTIFLAMFVSLNVKGGTGWGNPRFVPFQAKAMSMQGVRPASWKESDMGDFVMITDMLTPEKDESSYVKFREWRLIWVQDRTTLRAELERWKSCFWREFTIANRPAFACGDHLKGQIGVLHHRGRMIYMEYSTPDEASYEDRLKPVLRSLTFDK